MSDEDKDLELLKARRLAEMQKNLSYKKMQQDNLSKLDEEKKSKPSPRQTVVNKLGYRGLEVLQNAEAQFPNETRMVIEKLAELIVSGEIDETLDGGKLLALFRAIGINVRLETKINIEQDGKFVSLTDKLTKKSTDSSEEST